MRTRNDMIKDTVGNIMASSIMTLDVRWEQSGRKYSVRKLVSLCEFDAAGDKTAWFMALAKEVEEARFKEVRE